MILEWKKVPCILKIAAGGTQLSDCVRRPRYRVLDYAHLPGGFSLGRALALFDMPLPSHLSHPGTCYLGDSNIHRFAVCLCLIVSPSLLFSLTLAHTRAHAHMHTHSKGSPRLSSPLSRSLSLLSLSLSLPPSAESHSGSLDQTLQRSRQRKVPPGAQLPI